ncbi:MAG: ComEC/Rec2 family competence protein [Candidatus Saccharibacteria bacterium]
MSTFKSFFQRIPFIRISLLFTLGILVSHYFPAGDQWIGGLLFFLILLLLLLWKNKHLKAIKIQNLIISLTLFLSGVFYPDKLSHSNLSIAGKKEMFVAEVCQRPIVKPNSYQTLLLLKNKALTSPEKVIAYFSKENFDTTIMPGDQLIIHGTLQEIEGKVNPYDFDYKGMMQNKGIYYSVYLSPGSYQSTGIKIHRVIYVAERVRDQLTALLYKTRLGKDERAVVSALTLGYRSELDKETMNYFVNTGTIHVLSVSGLHVALVFYILSLLFTPLKRGMAGLYLYPAIVIVCLWGYAFITGFSPSVQRSTVMFSFVIIGTILRRPVNIYNSLTASAVLLILIDPKVLFDIGFQLSYLAIFGIIWLQPPMEHLIPVKNKILKWMWTLFTVSLAAQLITFPLSIYYFNQFPYLFWLSNFIAIPGTTFIIWLTFLFFILSPITLVSNLLAIIIQYVTYWMLFLLKWISQQPHAVLEGIVYSQYQTILVYGLIGCILIYCFSKRKPWLFAGLIILILFQSSMLFNKHQFFNQKMIYAYHSRSTIIQCINGRDSYVLKNDNRPYQEQDIRAIQNVCDHLKLRKPTFLNTSDIKNLKRDDLLIKSNRINFLNCEIDFKDQLLFHIKGKDINQFQVRNTELFKKISADQSLTYLVISPAKKESFALEFTIPPTKGICILIN